jgi:polar amino acid transport system substrate-binding protein
MKRLALAIAVLALAAGVVTALGVAAPFSGAGGNSAAGTSIKKKPKFPKLPADVKSRHRWVIGVKCDFPPFGFIDVQGHNAGYDVQVARRFATLAFGRPNRITLVCVTTPSRIPTLQSSRVDMIISTLTWTAARTQVIDFSIPYYSATGRLLVPNSSNIKTVHDLDGKTIVTTRGALYATWVRNCFKSSKLLEVDGTAAAVQAVKEGRADTFMFDDAFLLGVATQDRDTKLTNDRFLNVPWGIGVRKGDVAMAKWVNAGIRYMQAHDEFAKIMMANAPKKYWPTFLGNVPRKGTHFAYPVGKDPTADCSST